MRSISWDFAADGADVTCVDASLVPTNVFSKSFLAEHIPIFLDEGMNFGAVLNGAISSFEVGVKLFLMEFRIKVNDVVGIPGRKRCFSFLYGSAMVLV